MSKEKHKLYRKENKSSLSSHYNVVTGSEYRYQRHTKDKKDLENLPYKTSMVSGKFKRDYSPFFKFFISKVGTDFNSACSEAKPRMDENFFKVLSWIFYDNNVGNMYSNGSMFMYGESTLFPYLIVDDRGLIQFKDVNYHNETKKFYKNTAFKLVE